VGILTDPLTTTAPPKTDLDSPAVFDPDTKNVTSVPGSDGKFVSGLFEMIRLPVTPILLLLEDDPDMLFVISATV
jgi:hypothetical protein